MRPETNSGKISNMAALSCFDLTGKVAIVTGGSQSIGKAIAKALAMSGARICITARTESKLEKTAEEIRALGAECIYAVADISDEEQMSKAFKKAVDHYGRLDIMVGNAAHGGYFKAPEDMTMEEWNTVMRQNVNGMFIAAKEAAKYMIPQKSGNIVLVCSIVTEVFGLHNDPGAYETSKGAVEVMIRSLAASWARHNIHVNGISPGYTLSDIVKANFASMEPGQYEKLCALVPFKRFAEPEEMAPMVVALCSDAASYMTGSIITIDGGRTVY